MTDHSDAVFFIDILKYANDLIDCGEDHPELLIETPDWSCRKTYYASLLPIIRLGNAVRGLSPAGRRNFSQQTLMWIEETSDLASHYDQYQQIDGERYNKFFSEDLKPFRDKALDLAPVEPT